MVDHGFIAPQAIKNAKNVAKYLDVPLTIIKRDYSDIFREALLKAKSPCRKCSRRTMEILRKYALKKGYRYMITGHELPFGTSPLQINEWRNNPGKDSILNVRGGKDEDP